MPIVPGRENFGVNPSAVPVNGLDGPRGPNASEIVGQEQQQFGQALQSTGGAAAKMAVDAQEQFNQVRVIDAVNKAHKAALDLTYDPQVGYLSQKGDAALTRQSGQALPDEYADKFQVATANIAGGLGNEQQRIAFARQAGSLGTQFVGQVQSHMLSEFRAYQGSTFDGTINVQSEIAKSSWNNPDVIGPAVQTMKAAVVEKGKLNGWSAVQTDAAILTAASKVHTDVVMTALENNNPAYALGYLDKNKSGMSADDILRVQGHVNHQVWTQQAMQALQGASTEAAPKFNPNGFDRLTNIVMGMESGGKRFAPGGDLLTSPKGAQGEMQVMPGTSADPGFGVRPAQDGSPGELARVGRDYLQAMIQRYGDPAKAMAAYNAGPGAVDKALKDTSEQRSGTAGPDWLSHLPKETRDYVANGISQLTQGGGQASKPTEAEYVANTISRLPPGSPPDVVKMARDAAVADYGVKIKSLGEQGDQAIVSAQQWLAQNNGDINHLPVQLRDAVVRLSPAKLDDLTTYGNNIAKGSDRTNMVMYQRLSTDQNFLRGMTDAQFAALRPEFSETDFKHFSTERGVIKNGPKPGDPGELNTSTVKTTLDNRLRGQGIDSSPKDSDTSGQAQIATIRQFVDQQIGQMQKQAGKKFNDVETEQAIDKLFATNETVKGWFTTKSLPRLAMSPGDVPNDIAKRIKQDFASRGISSPSDAQIFGAYLQIKQR